MTPPLLPQELIDEIIDHLGLQRHYEALKSCALTSRAFSSRSQKHIFSTFDIDARLHKNRKQRCSRFYRLLQERPEFANHVRELYISCPWSLTSTDWVAKEADFARITSSLTSLEVFVLMFHQGTGSPIEWSKANHNFRSVFLNFSNTNLTVLHLGSIVGLPASVFLHLPPTLIDLSLNMVDVETFDPDTCLSTFESADHSKRPKLRFLSIIDSRDVLPILLLSVDFSRLRKFELSYAGESELVAAQEMIAMAALSLKSLICRIHHASATDLFLKNTEFNKLFNLRFLVLECDISSLGHISSLLERAPNLHRIEELELNIHCSYISSRSWKYLSDSSGWVKLAGVLANTGCACIPTVNISLKMAFRLASSEDICSSELLEAQFMRHFPNFYLVSGVSLNFYIDVI